MNGGHSIAVYVQGTVFEKSPRDYRGELRLTANRRVPQTRLDAVYSLETDRTTLSGLTYEGENLRQIEQHIVDLVLPMAVRDWRKKFQEGHELRTAPHFESKSVSWEYTHTKAGGRPKVVVVRYSYRLPEEQSVPKSWLDAEKLDALIDLGLPSDLRIQLGRRSVQRLVGDEDSDATWANVRKVVEDYSY